MTSPPRRDQPEMPEGYVPDDVEPRLVAWPTVVDRLDGAEQYWMATTRPDGRPHVVPRWGVWVDDRLFYDGSPETVHARNLAADPRCVLHIGDGWETVIVEGSARRSDPLDVDEGRPIAEAIGRKYGARGYTPEPDAWSGPDAGGMIVFTPAKALVWFDFPNDLTRFRFGT